MISIVIPVKDGGEDLRRCLEAVARQETTDEVEVLVIDSGSVDGSPETAAGLGARVERIRPEDFNHAATRNLGARLAQGEILVFTVDDALPVGDDWLERLVAPLREENRIAATYSRQVATDDAPPNQRIYVERRYGPNPRIQRASSPGELTVETMLFSDVSSAIRRSVLESVPFADDAIIAEDQEWCARALLAGHEVAYVPASVVRHSHTYTLPQLFRRFFDLGVAERTILRPRAGSARRVGGEGLRLLRDELVTLARSGQARWIPYALGYEATRFAGFKLGEHYRLVPVPLRRRWSRLAIYWSRAEPAGALSPPSSAEG